MPASLNKKLLVAYDGENFLGWQKTKEGRSVEETLQIVLEQILQKSIVLNAASRTDAGVHAEGQTVNFFSPKNIANKILLKSLNALLPLDLRVMSVEDVPHAFHATTDCKGKEYHYWICSAPVQLPLLRRHTWHYPNPMNLTAMKKGAEFLIGRHDFAAYCNTKKNESYEDTVRSIEEITINQHSGDLIQIILKGNRFLYKMARNLAGALATVGRGQLEPKDLQAILKSKDRTQAPITAPAHGLTLFKTFY